LTLPKGSDPEALFRAYAPWLLRTLRRQFGREVADDLLQETYLRVMRRPSRS
jgi:DNA-directed RNA polymerase specialized sigma24 family protein